MRLIRSVCRPANAGLSPRFQRCQDTKISSACLHPVLNETSNRVHTSNILCNDRSYAASASAASSALEDRKPQKRVSKSERRIMVENYVNKYREKTEGKFPSPSDTMKDVGGSYYVVRQILQEMIYTSKQSSMACKDTSLDKSTRKKNEMIYNSKESEDIKDISLEKSAIKNHEMVTNAKEQSVSVYTNDTSLEKSTMKEDRRSTKFEEVPQSRELGKGTRPILKDIEISSSMIFQSKQGQESSVSNETDEPKDIGAQSHHPIDKLESSQNLDYEKDVKQAILEDHVKSDALERKARGQESMEISGRGSQQMPSEEAEAQQKSSVWNNLKSFANGIFSLWKRS